MFIIHILLYTIFSYILPYICFKFYLSFFTNQLQFYLYLFILLDGPRRANAAIKNKSIFHSIGTLVKSISINISNCYLSFFMYFFISYLSFFLSSFHHLFVSFICSYSAYSYNSLNNKFHMYALFIIYIFISHQFYINLRNLQNYTD